ncbi:MAG: ABC transporter ATP-binding protein/permease [Holosporales bacterium]|jgi:ABC-type multidrug transport system fused ATPase/permease subunit|nr:ABC transporter ATP-binding protein/permease [Holosporales bacterium]
MGVFHFYFIEELPQNISFYITISSIFICIMSFILISHYTNILKKHSILKKLENFTSSSINLDISLLHDNNMQHILDSFLDYIDNTEKKIIEFHSRVIPFLTIFISISILTLILNFKILFFLLGVILILHVIVPFLVFIKYINNIKNINSSVKKFCKISINAIKGIQFFEIGEEICSKFERKMKKILNTETIRAERSVWKSFFILCFIFIIICFSYFFTDNEYTSEIFKATNQYSVLVILAIFFYILFLRSFIKYRKFSFTVEPILNEFVSKNRQPISETNPVILNKDNIFIALHGVSFHNPSLASNEPIFRDLTFSILPREVISIVGERASKDAHYIFDLLLKFYQAQSGNIYISGTSIKNIDSKTIHSLFAILKIDFGIIDGTVAENILASFKNDIDNKNFLKIAEKVGLLDFLEEEVCDQDHKIIASSEIITRIQIARIFMRNNDFGIILIEFPEKFDSQETKELFYDFVSFMVKKKTIIVITDFPQIIVNSDKILYMGKDSTIFGSHADLVSDPEYDSFLKKQ